VRTSRMQIPSIRKHIRVGTILSGFALVALFVLYTSGISRNPPGFYMDESATAYNAYMMSRTGHPEFGPRFPLLIQWYTGPSTSYVNPATMYLMAVFFRFVPPSVVAARMFAAFWMFSACLLLGVLAKRLSGRKSVGIIVGGTALLTPWFVEVGRLVWDAHFVPMAVMLFLLAAYRAQSKETWSWREVAMLAGSLGLLTYGYFAGRVLAPLFALGLLFFATTRDRLFGIIKVWLVYAITLVPTLIFSWRHPGALANRFELATYIKPGVSWRDSAAEFIRRYLEDQSVIGLLQTGHPLPRHHVIDAGGVFFFATFFLAMLGFLIVVVRHLGEPWWRFTLYGLAVSIVPGAITFEPFHALRLLALPIFLLLLTVPALEWLLDFGEEKTQSSVRNEGLSFVPRPVRFAVLGFLLTLTIFEAARFQRIYRRYGPERGVFFDAPYKEAYDAAVAQPQRPIFLRDGFYGPSYVNGLWYAAVEGRPRPQFVHLASGANPPSGAIVLSSEQNCEECQIIKRSGIYLLYRQK
jgi:4-amino-4-deoxy-L-arabinose transferase-like glycosyltransferase